MPRGQLYNLFCVTLSVTLVICVYCEHCIFLICHSVLLQQSVYPGCLLRLGICFLLYMCLLSHSFNLLHDLLFFPLPLTGDGDQEHALLSNGVRQEWGDLRWVIYYSTKSSWPLCLKHCPIRFKHVFPLAVAQKASLCVSNVVCTLTNKEVSKCFWPSFSSLSYLNPSLRGHMVDGKLRSCSDEALAMCLAEHADVVLFSLAMCVEWH